MYRSVIYALFGASFTILTAWALGALLLRKLSSSLYRLEERLLAIITGSACLGTIVFALCTMGLARKGTYLSLGLLIIFFAVRSGAHHPRGERFSALPRVWKSLFLVVFIVLTAVYVLGGLTAEVYPGDTTRHLSMVDRGRGFQSGATLSEGAQLMLLPAFAFGRHSAIALVDLGLLASLTLLMLCYGRRVGHPIVGVTGAILYYACPLAGNYFSVTVDVETAVVLFALFYLVQLWDQPDTGELAIPIGILAGFSYAANHVAIVAFPYAIGFIAWKLWRQRKPLFGPVLAVSVLALALIVPWIVQERMWGTSVAFALPSLANRDTRFLTSVAPAVLLAMGIALSRSSWVVSSAGAGARRLWRATFRMPGPELDDTGLSAAFRIPTWFTRHAGGGFVLAYFMYFAWDGLHAHFIHDDPANIAYYWSRGVWPLIRAEFVFFSTYYRPMGGLFYLPIYHFAGFHPVPYRALGLLIILLNIALFYRVAKLLSGSERVAWLAAILVSYHPHLMDMIYQNSNIYDVLCFLFYFAALAWYLGIRARGRLCNWRETAVCVALYICALDSKEMAVTLPVTLALFELLFHPPAGIKLKTILMWLNREGRVTCIAAMLTAVYVVGKTVGPDPLTDLSAYRPEFTVQRFIVSITSNIRTLFYLPDWFGPGYVFGACAALLAFAWVKRTRYVAFCVLFAILSELPIAFVPRSGPSLYIPLAAWAMLVSAAVWAAARLAASVFRERAVRLVVTGLLVAVFLSLNARRAWSETQVLRPFFYAAQATTWSVIQQFADFKINPKPGARIAFLHDPLPYPTTLFLAQLRFQDPSLSVLLSTTAPPEPELSTVDYIFDYQDGRFIQVKPAPVHPK